MWFGGCLPWGLPAELLTPNGPLWRYGVVYSVILEIMELQSCSVTLKQCYACALEAEWSDKCNLVPATPVFVWTTLCYFPIVFKCCALQTCVCTFSLSFLWRSEGVVQLYIGIAITVARIFFFFFLTGWIPYRFGINLIQHVQMIHNASCNILY